MSFELLINNGYKISASIGNYSVWERGLTPVTVILLPNGEIREALLQLQHTNFQEYIRDISLKRVLEIVSLLPGVQSYPSIANELNVIASSLASYGQIVSLQ